MGSNSIGFSYAILSAAIGCALGIASGYYYQPLSDWWLGQYAPIISIVMSLIFAALVLIYLADKEVWFGHMIMGVFQVPVGAIVATLGILVSVNIIFSIAFSIIGLRNFSWVISNVPPTDSERLAASVFNNAVTIAGVVFSVLISILVVMLTAFICFVVPNFMIDRITHFSHVTRAAHAREGEVSYFCQNCGKEYDESKWIMSARCRKCHAWFCSSPDCLELLSRSGACPKCGNPLTHAQKKHVKTLKTKLE